MIRDLIHHIFLVFCSKMLLKTLQRLRDLINLLSLNKYFTFKKLYFFIFKITQTLYLYTNICDLRFLNRFVEITRKSPGNKWSS